MVKKIVKNKKELYKCEECEMYYKKEEMARKCEDFCKTHNACNTELIKHAVFGQ